MNPLLAELTQPIKAAKAGLPKAREKVTQNDVPTQRHALGRLIVLRKHAKNLIDARDR